MRLGETVLILDGLRGGCDGCAGTGLRGAAPATVAATAAQSLRSAAVASGQQQLRQAIARGETNLSTAAKARAVELGRQLATLQATAAPKEQVVQVATAVTRAAS
ncbi:MAG: hypothetical protein ABII82_01930, partial [Verrucomicrobiota bacterium]